jgi:tetratricopeptide (TPR) repeat protein
MNKSVPIINQTSWKHQIFPLVALIALIIGMSRLDESYGFFWGITLYFMYSYGVRWLLTNAHRRGISLMSAEHFPEAITAFQESVEFIIRHPWIDKYRWVVLLSPSSMSYHEMGLANIAFSYAQLGDGKIARHFYQECLKVNPKSVLAKCSLKMLDAGAASGT